MTDALGRETNPGTLVLTNGPNGGGILKNVTAFPNSKPCPAQTDQDGHRRFVIRTGKQAGGEVGSDGLRIPYLNDKIVTSKAGAISFVLARQNPAVRTYAQQDQDIRDYRDWLDAHIKTPDPVGAQGWVDQAKTNGTYGKPNLSPQTIKLLTAYKIPIPEF